MRLESSSAERIVIVSRQPIQGGVGVAVLLFVTGLLPFASEQMTLWRWLTVFGFFSLGLVIFKLSLPRQQRLVLNLKTREIEATPRISFSEIEALELAGRAPIPNEVVRLDYTVQARLKDGSTLTLLRAQDPAKVLADLQQLMTGAGFDIRSGWSLAEDCWLLRSLRGESGEGLVQPLKPTLSTSITLAPHDSPVPGGIVVLIGGVGTGIMWGRDLYTRWVSELPIAPLSVWVALSASGLLCLLGVGLISHRLKLQLGERVSLSDRILGVYRERFSLAPSEVLGIYPVGPHPELSADASNWHLLFHTAQGLYAIPCQPESIQRILSEVSTS